MIEKPTDGLMNMAEYAKHRRMHRSSISRLASKGVLVMRQTRRGMLVDVAASDRVLDDRPVIIDPPPAMSTQGGQQRLSYAEARTAKVIYEAKLCKLAYDQKRGELINAASVRDRIFESTRTLRDGVLAIPARCCATITAELDAGRATPGPVSPRRVQELLTQEIRRALTELSDSLLRDGLLKENADAPDGLH